MNKEIMLQEFSDWLRENGVDNILIETYLEALESMNKIVQETPAFADSIYSIIDTKGVDAVHQKLKRNIAYKIKYFISGGQINDQALNVYAKFICDPKARPTQNSEDQSDRKTNFPMPKLVNYEKTISDSKLISDCASNINIEHSGNYIEGELIYHRDFGWGTITDVTSNAILVKFESGIAPCKAFPISTLDKMIVTRKLPVNDIESYQKTPPIIFEKSQTPSVITDSNEIADISNGVEPSDSVMVTLGVHSAKYIEGERIQHRDFGWGKVTDVTSNAILIKFDSGISQRAFHTKTLKEVIVARSAPDFSQIISPILQEQSFIRSQSLLIHSNEHTEEAFKQLEIEPKFNYEVQNSISSVLHIQVKNIENIDNILSTTANEHKLKEEYQCEVSDQTTKDSQAIDSLEKARIVMPQSEIRSRYLLVHSDEEDNKSSQILLSEAEIADGIITIHDENGVKYTRDERVKHCDLGWGTVTHVTSKALYVKFDSGLLKHRAIHISDIASVIVERFLSVDHIETHTIESGQHEINLRLNLEIPNSSGSVHQNQVRDSSILRNENTMKFKKEIHCVLEGQTVGENLSADSSANSKNTLEKEKIITSHSQSNDQCKLEALSLLSGTALNDDGNELNNKKCVKYSNGDRVEHRELGWGTVIDVTATLLRIRFDSYPLSRKSIYLANTDHWIVSTMSNSDTKDALQRESGTTGGLEKRSGIDQEFSESIIHTTTVNYETKTAKTPSSAKTHENISSNLDKTISKYIAGARVNHRYYGWGTVIESSSMLISVSFDSSPQQRKTFSKADAGDWLVENLPPVESIETPKIKQEQASVAALDPADQIREKDNNIVTELSVEVKRTKETKAIYDEKGKKYTLGDRVRHRNLGWGTIAEITAMIFRVRFDSSPSSQRAFFPTDVDYWLAEHIPGAGEPVRPLVLDDETIIENIPRINDNILPRFAELNIVALEQTLQPKYLATSYKIFWFSAILAEIDEGNICIPYERLVARMITAAWKPIAICDFKLETIDKMTNVTKYLKWSGKYDAPLSDSAFFNAVLHQATYDAILKKYISWLTRYVPYRFLAPFYEYNLAGIKDSQKNKLILELSVNSQSLYSFGQDSIIISPRWFEYIRNNQSALKSWVREHLVQYLKNLNPEIVDIAQRLSDQYPLNIIESENNMDQFYKNSSRADQHNIVGKAIVEQKDQDLSVLGFNKIDNIDNNFDYDALKQIVLAKHSEANVKIQVVFWEEEYQALIEFCMSKEWFTMFDLLSHDLDCLFESDGISRRQIMKFRDGVSRWCSNICRKAEKSSEKVDGHLLNEMVEMFFDRNR